METNRCEQVGGSADRSFIALTRPALLGACCAEPPLRAVVFIAADVERTRVAVATNLLRSQLASSGDCPPDSLCAVRPALPR